MKQFQIIATLFVVCLLPTFAFGQFVQSCPHNTSGDNCPDLLYNPADGSVIFEVDGQNQDPNASVTPRPRSISAFSIAAYGQSCMGLHCQSTSGCQWLASRWSLRLHQHSIRLGQPKHITGFHSQSSIRTSVSIRT